MTHKNVSCTRLFHESEERKMKRCSKCGKPLTEFEIKFHRNASSGSDLSSQCWNCIRGDELFGRYKNLSLQIKACLVGFFVLAFALLLENRVGDLNDMADIILIILSGIIPTIAILFFKPTHSDTRDPSEQHYSYDYSESSYYEGHLEDSGTLVIEKKNDNRFNYNKQLEKTRNWISFT